MVQASRPSPGPAVVIGLGGAEQSMVTNSLSASPIQSQTEQDQLPSRDFA